MTQVSCDVPLLREEPGDISMQSLTTETLAANVGQFFRDVVARYGQQDAMVFFNGGETLSYAELGTRVYKLASSLSKRGVTLGTRVAVMTYTDSHYPIAWLAVVMLGATAIPVNFKYTPRELHYILADAQADLLILHQDFMATLKGMDTQLLANTQLVVIGERTEVDMLQWDELVSAGDPEFIPTQEATLEDLMNIQYTSGTTGLPKGAMLPHHYWLIMTAVGATQVKFCMQRTLLWQPFYYVDAQWQLLATLSVGGTAFIAGKMSTTNFLDWLKSYQINFCIFPEVVSRSSEKPDDGDNNLVAIYCYSHPSDNYARYEQRYGCLARQGFAMTEVGIATYVPFNARHMTGTGTVGIPAAFRRVMIADSLGNELPRGTEGEICIAGEGIFSGYINRPEVTAKSFHKNQWFRTGDRGYQDKNGWFYFLGRIKDMVRRSGENISSLEVEAVLRSASGVLEAAIVPVPDDTRGEEVKAYIRLLEGYTSVTASPNMILRHCSENLAPFKIPRFIEYIEDFPRTPSNKIKKVDLLAAKKDLRVGSYDSTIAAWIK